MRWLKKPSRDGSGGYIVGKSGRGRHAQGIASISAGWYPDPDDRELRRWWDGDRFTEKTKPRSTP